MANGLKVPHIFNASSNCQKMISNLSGVLTAAELDKIRVEIDSNVIALYRLGELHYKFAQGLDAREWRQRTSRLYYGAYNTRRAVSLKYDGSFSTDASDHKNIDALPDTFPNVAKYKTQLKDLRDDRNLADYNHLAQESDLLIASADSLIFVTDFMTDAKEYLKLQGIIL